VFVRLHSSADKYLALVTIIRMCMSQVSAQQVSATTLQWVLHLRLLAQSMVACHTIPCIECNACSSAKSPPARSRQQRVADSKSARTSRFSMVVAAARLSSVRAQRQAHQQPHTSCLRYRTNHPPQPRYSKPCRWCERLHAPAAFAIRSKQSMRKAPQTCAGAPSTGSARSALTCCSRYRTLHARS
jgi:hypothetical protein